MFRLIDPWILEQLALVERQGHGRVRRMHVAFGWPHVRYVVELPGHIDSVQVTIPFRL